MNVVTRVLLLATIAAISGGVAFSLTPVSTYTRSSFSRICNRKSCYSWKSPLEVTRSEESEILVSNGEDEVLKDTKTLRVKNRNPVKIYTDYASRLWKETNRDARQRAARDVATAAVRDVEHMFNASATEYSDLSAISEENRNNLLKACSAVLDDANGQSTEDKKIGKVEKSETGANESKGVKAKKKSSRSILFGATMGLAVACWVFSGNYVFTGLFSLMTIVGQLEYYRMVMQTGVYPARRISVIGAASMFLTALFAPSLHEICLPMFGLWAMIHFLTSTRRQTIPSIPDIAATFTGMFYLGYVPSFWVRIRLIGIGREPTRLASIAGPILSTIQRSADAQLPSFVPKAIHLPITTGAIFIFWTWLCLAFSDVGAYFVGRSFGKTKLGVISPSLEQTSPNKTLQGLYGGCAVSAVLGMFGAWVQKWPMWALTGAIHGTMLAILGTVGDLTASMLKRNSGLKDFGDLIPEHGGILDRVDSFIWSAPYSWLVCAYIIPALKGWKAALV